MYWFNHGSEQVLVRDKIGMLHIVLFSVTKLLKIECDTIYVFFIGQVDKVKGKTSSYDVH